MKKSKTKVMRAVSLLLAMLIASGVWASALPAFADDGKDIRKEMPMFTVNVKTSAGTFSGSVVCTHFNTVYGCQGRSWERINADLLKDTETATVTVTKVNTELIDKNSLKFPKTITLKRSEGSSVTVTYTDVTGDEDDIEFSIKTNDKLTAEQANSYYKINGIYVGTSKKGFHPSKGNKLNIKCGIELTGNVFFSLSKVTVKILNSNNKWVFKDTGYCTNTGTMNIDFDWNGKAAKKNEAGLKAGKYVPNGNYKVMVQIKEYKDENGQKSYLPAVSRSIGFKVSSKAPKGKKGLKAAKKCIIYTGNGKIDYMAEQILKKAKVKASMSADKKVKKIYHYMTVNFKHFTSGKHKNHFNLKKLKTKIKNYKKANDKKAKNNKLIYFPNNFVLESNFNKFGGSCTENALIFTILCRHVGVTSNVCCGYYLNNDGTKPVHSWNSAVINGKTYYYDVDIELSNRGKGQGDYYWYKKTKSQSKKNHEYYKNYIFY